MKESLNITFVPFLQMLEHQLNYKKTDLINNELVRFESKWALLNI